MLERQDYNKVYFNKDDASFEDLKSSSAVSMAAGYGFSYFFPELHVNNLVAAFPELVGAKVLDLGCGPGDSVRIFRKVGVDCYGLDFSDYAVKTANSEFVSLGDATIDLVKYEDDAFDYVVSFSFLQCLSDEDLLKVHKQLNRISKRQFHFPSNTQNADLYNVKTLSEWRLLGFEAYSFQELEDGSINK